MSVSAEKRSYKNFGECMFLDNGSVTVGVTLEFGPRVIYLTLDGKKNILFEDEERRFTERAGEYGTWINYGGHRLWRAPELVPETYFPDNDKAEYSVSGNGITLTAPETPFGNVFSISLELDESEPVISLEQKIKNVSDHPSEYAPWSITTLTGGAACIVPINTAQTGFLPNRVISLWPFSDIADSRFKMTDSQFRIKQDNCVQKPFKVGFNVEDGFLACFVNEQIFVKCIEGYRNDVRYPDYQCNSEVYTNCRFIECEQIGELREFAPGEEAVIKEKWCLFDNPSGYESCDIRKDIGDRVKDLLII